MVWPSRSRRHLRTSLYALSRYFTFSLFTGAPQIGQSLFDKNGSEKVADLVAKAKKNNVELVFPVDYITADKFDKDANVRK